MPDARVTVSLSSRLGPAFTVAGAALGGVAAMLIRPTTSWMMDRLDGSPAPLRLLDQLPLSWSVPLLAVLGAVAGFLIYAAWNHDVGTVTVDAQTVTVDQKTGAAVFRHAEISDAFLDKDDLVLLARDSRELSRTPSENGLASELKEAFGMFGLPWSGTTDPRDVEFHPWVDRSRELDAELHTMLRERRRALADGRSGEAESLRDQLTAHGVIVRDRDGAQQIRILPD
ncbi:YqeB family protein [Nesterenkonia xinjiangensis]|uniref:Uncharacterized protein n=1 Tax=Nesterenkonia xinjiangensis TaxID=225327 RepID=A0A7Z0GKJ0_9MICC|nr:hypothetical protein [Nesterenkonia xinjiangensis]NYJ77699.1 hypothetical protein [Nesterenkonia xinjiangensis]